MLLLVLAALFTQSLANVARVDLGLRTESIVTFRCDAELERLSARAAARRCSSRVERELAAQPGVDAASRRFGGVAAPDSQWGTGVAVEGFEPAQQRESWSTPIRSAPVSSRRSTSRCCAAAISPTADTLDRPRVAIVNESFAKRFGLGGNPVGKRLGFESRRARSTSRSSGSFAIRRTTPSRATFPAQLIMPRRQTRTVRRWRHVLRAQRRNRRKRCCAAVPRSSARVDSSLPVMEPTHARIAGATQRADRLAARDALRHARGASRRCSRRSASTAFSRIWSRSARARSACGSRSAREPAGVRRMVLKQVGWMAGIGVPIGLGCGTAGRQSGRVVVVRLGADGPAAP